MEMGWIPFKGAFGSYSSRCNRACIENCRYEWQVLLVVNEVVVRVELAERKVEDSRDCERKSNCAARRSSILVWQR